MLDSIKNLLVINNVMDSEDALLSHQVDNVKALSKYFDSVTVITSRSGLYDLPSNVSVHSTGWKQGQNFRNTVRFLNVFFRNRPRGQFLAFSHMADVQAAIISPILYLMRRRHGLWYAHSYVSIYLKFASMFVDFILTATSGSCNLKSRKVFVIGHGVDEKVFNFQHRQTNRLEKILTVGRLDPSKHLEKILEFYVEATPRFPDLTLTSVGGPSTRDSEEFLEGVIERYKDAFASKTVQLLPPVKRSSVAGLLNTHDVFVHAYLGSLDKSILEATFSGIPVVTLNYQYHEVFGVWGGLENRDSLYLQFVALRDLSFDELDTEIERRFQICSQKHSLAHWSQAVVARLQNPR